VIASFRAFADIARRSSRALAEIGLAAARDADVVVTGFSAAILADAIASKLGRPLVQAYNVPITASASMPGALFPALDLGPVSRRLGHALTRAALWQMTRTSCREVATEILGAPAIPLLPPASSGFVPGPLVYGLGEAFLSRPSDWPAEIEVTGFWLVAEPDGFTSPRELERFLDASSPPVCVGFGSMSTEKREEVSALVVDAARAARTRLVLLSGWAGLEAEQLSDDVLTLRAAPHGWLYPRCRAVVHHGGRRHHGGGGLRRCSCDRRALPRRSALLGVARACPRARAHADPASQAHHGAPHRGPARSARERSDARAGRCGGGARARRARC
jgi:UDP:flavonoid glycosyltransferase YjiC (YdhE family)